MSAYSVKIKVKVMPSAGRNEIVGQIGDVWKIKIAAPPEKGKANKELIEFLSDRLRVRKENVIILKGETKHNKVLAVEGLNPEDIVAVLLSDTKNKR